MYRSELFSEQNFHEASERRKEALIREIQAYDAASIIGLPIEKLSNYFEDRFKMETPQLVREDIYLLDTPKEVTSRERIRDRVWDDEYVNVDRSYIQFTVCVPFKGDASLFSIRPTSYTYNMSRTMNAQVHGNEIRISYNELVGDRAADFNSLYDGDVQMIATNLDRLANDARMYNQQLQGLINQRLSTRKQEVEKNSGIISAFKIPIKKRDDLPATYAIPDVQRKPQIIESPKTKTFTPEPTIAPEEYENILTIIKDMALSMERSPHTFSKLSEEEIRDFFLIHLNGHYQGAATGETFNGNGKTDILIRHQNANAFIAECKIWKGQSKMSGAIDQLLGYVTWRDTKTAIILFNKQASLSSVIEKARETLKQHPNFKSEISFASAKLNESETVYLYKFIHPHDPDKEIFLALMGFQIIDPTGQSEEL